MKITTTTTTILFVLLCALGINVKAQTTSKEATIQAWVVVNKAAPSITIRWMKETGVANYQIYRKAKNETSWGTTPKGAPKASDSMWTDTDVKVGVVYEYNFIKLNTAQSVIGVTYLLSGIEIPLVHSRGNALLVVEKTLSNQISTELNQYMNDIAADGWKVYTLEVLKTDSIQKVKREIKKIDVQAKGLTSLIILGHVPVPYSGNFDANTYPPDGHMPDHNGCWPTDAYYTIDYDQWGDAVTNNLGTRAENKNLPGDSKWDNIFLPGVVKYQSGRIDLSNLPKFNKTEAELTKQYIKKAHDFRYKITPTVEKSVIDENFPASAGYFASTGWRNFSVMFGPNNIIVDDYFATCQNENLLFAYACGPGSYTSCGGVGNTDNFVTQKGAVFNMLFGSYFGDWDIADNFLRAPLAAAENGLTNAWSGRPWWQNHQMALGEPIGYCAMVTENNQGTYEYNIYTNTVPVGLMGDPTLRLHIIAPPTNVIATAQSNNTKVSLSWTASNEAGNLGYYIYRSGNPLNNSIPINTTPITTTTYIDNTPYQGGNYYLIKTVKLTTSASGTYFNLSHGSPVNIGGITGITWDVKDISKQSMTIYPNPAIDAITIQFPNYQNSKLVEIYNAQGQLVKSFIAELDGDLKTQTVSVSDMRAGIYFIKSANVVSRFIKE